MKKSETLATYHKLKDYSVGEVDPTGHSALKGSAERA
jgi:hypothetical protein